MSIKKNVKIFLPVTKVWFAEQSIIDPDIESITENIDGSVSVLFASGAYWKLLYQTAGLAEFEETETKQDEGSKYTQSLVVNFPGDGIENQQILKKLQNKELIIKIDMPDSESKIIGSIQNPVFFKKDLKSSNYQTSSEISINHVSYIPAQFINEQ